MQDEIWVQIKLDDLTKLKEHAEYYRMIVVERDQLKKEIAALKQQLPNTAE